MSFAASGFALAALVVGVGLNYYNQEQTEEKADNVEAQNIEKQTALDKQANQNTQHLLQQDSSNNSDSSQKSALLQQFQKAVAANQSNATGGLNQVGNVSQAYKQAAQNASLGVSQYATNQATALAGMDAPGLQRQQENANLAAYGSQIGAINQQSQGDAALANIQLQGVQQNPWLAAVASGLQAYGTSGAGMGGMMGGGVATGVQSDTGTSYPTIGGFQMNLPSANGYTS